MDKNKKDEILDLLKKDGETVLSAIAGKLSINHYYAERYLEELMAEGKIQSRTEEKYGKTIKFFKLKEEKKKDGDAKSRKTA